MFLTHLPVNATQHPHLASACLFRYTPVLFSWTTFSICPFHDYPAVLHSSPLCLFFTSHLAFHFPLYAMRFLSSFLPNAI